MEAKPPHIPLLDRASGTDGTLATDGFGVTSWSNADQERLEHLANQSVDRDTQQQTAKHESQLRQYVIALTADIAKATGLAAGDIAELLAVLDAYARNGPTALPKSRPRKIAP